METSKFSRRSFIATTGIAAAGSLITNPVSAMAPPLRNEKRRVVLVGTGVRGTSF